MNSEVSAAVIALAGALVGVIATIFVTTSMGRRQRDNELVISALSHLVGGSQNRAAGIAALTILRGANQTGGESRGWGRYRPAIDELIFSQLLYLLLHGGNRGQAHEIANMDSMASWLIDGGAPILNDHHKRKQLRNAMETYAFAPAPPESDLESIHQMQGRIENEWRGRLADPERS